MQNFWVQGGNNWHVQTKTLWRDFTSGTNFIKMGRWLGTHREKLLGRRKTVLSEHRNGYAHTGDHLQLLRKSVTGAANQKEEALWRGVRATINTSAYLSSSTWCLEKTSPCQTQKTSDVEYSRCHQNTWLIWIWITGWRTGESLYSEIRSRKLAQQPE